MTIDLSNKTVEELNRTAFDDEITSKEASDELARRLEAAQRENTRLRQEHKEMGDDLEQCLIHRDQFSSELEEAQQQIVAQQAIKTRCPSCGNQTLFVSDNGALCCSWIPCKDPTAINNSAAHDAKVAARAKADALEDAYYITWYESEESACKRAAEKIARKAAKYRAEAGRKE